MEKINEPVAIPESKLYFTANYKSLWAGSLIGATPFRFNRKQKKFVFSKFSYRFFKLNFLLLIIMQGFMYIQTIRFHTAGLSNHFNLSYAFNIGSGIILITMLVPALFPHELLTAMNGFMIYFNRIYNIYMPDYDPETATSSKLLEFLMVSVISNMMGTSLLLSLVFIIFPQVPVCFGNVIPPEFFTLPVRIVHTLYYVQMSTVIYANFAAVAAMIITYMFLMVPFMVNEFRMKGVKKYRTVGGFRTARNIMLEYRSIQILHLTFMNVIGNVLVPFHFVIMKLVLFCNVVVILYHNEMYPAVAAMLGIWSILCTVFWCVTLALGGYVFSKSLETTRSWKNWKWKSRFDGVIMTKFRKSCKPFMINYGNMYVIKRRSILKFMKGLTRGTFRVLLAIKK
ncbi:unnamed protein product [Orchesella dallaii]|uniref:Odorant receptor n=1 Tax=Orchesella dallaii TaxID=48710 RepID=A0ABP1RP37_9HEXA